MIGSPRIVHMYRLICIEFEESWWKVSNKGAREDLPWKRTLRELVEEADREHRVSATNSLLILSRHSRLLLHFGRGLSCCTHNNLEVCVCSIQIVLLHLLHVGAGSVRCIPFDREQCLAPCASRRTHAQRSFMTNYSLLLYITCISQQTTHANGTSMRKWNESHD